MRQDRRMTVDSASQFDPRLARPRNDAVPDMTRPRYHLGTGVESRTSGGVGDHLVLRVSSCAKGSAPTWA